MKRTPKRVTRPGGGPVVTKQAEGYDRDPGNIMARHRRAGTQPLLPPPTADEFRDVSDAPDLMEAMNRVATVRRMFNELPARTRATFSNNPVQLLEDLAHLDDPDALARLVATGFVQYEEPAPQPPASPSQPATAAPAEGQPKAPDTAAS